MGTKCSGDAQGEFERRIIPAFSRERNSSSAMRCFSGSNRRGLAKTGAALTVSMWCTTPWSGLGCAALGRSRVGNSSSSFCTWGGRTATAAGRSLSSRGCQKNCYLPE